MRRSMATGASRVRDVQNVGNDAASRDVLDADPRQRRAASVVNSPWDARKNAPRGEVSSRHFFENGVDLRAKEDK